MSRDNVLALITARGGSKGIPDKNMRLLLGKPLIYYTVVEALKSSKITKLGLSTDSDRILEYCRSLGLQEKYQRPDLLAGDTVTSLKVVQDYVKDFVRIHQGNKPDLILLLQPTSPLRTVTDIEVCIERMQNSNADSLVSVVEAPHNFIPESIMHIEGEYLKPYQQDTSFSNRQMKPKYYGRNGAAIYLFTYDCIMLKNSLYGDSCLHYIMPKGKSVDIDDMYDFELCEYLMKRKET